MKRFTDEHGDDWVLKVNAVSLARVEDALGVSFTAEPDDTGGPFMRIATDAMFCFRVLYVLCKNQCGDRGLSDEDFSERLVGDSLGRAQAAALESIADFYPQPAQREACRLLAAKIREAEQAMIEGARTQLESVDVGELVRDPLKNGVEHGAG